MDRANVSRSLNEEHAAAKESEASTEGNLVQNGKLNRKHQNYNPNTSPLIPEEVKLFKKSKKKVGRPRSSFHQLGDWRRGETGADRSAGGGGGPCESSRTHAPVMGLCG